MRKKILLLVASALLVMLVLGCPNESTEPAPGLDTSLWASVNGTWVDSDPPTYLAIIDAKTIFAIQDSHTVYNLTIDGHIGSSTDDNKIDSIFLTVTDTTVPPSTPLVRSVKISISGDKLDSVAFYSDAAATLKNKISFVGTFGRKIANYAAEQIFSAGTYTRAAKSGDVPVLEESIVVTAAVAGAAETPATIKIGDDDAAKVYAGHRATTATYSTVHLVTEKGVMIFNVPPVDKIALISYYYNVGASVAVDGAYLKVN